MSEKNLSLSNFAKAVLGKDEKKDTVDAVYGTVHIDGDNIMLEIDGSNGFRTPANTQIEVVDGQRVQAEIKNHIVTIVGSTENVAVGNSSYQRLKSVVADEGYFDELEANGLTVAGIARASQVIAEKVEADYGEFKNVMIDQGTFNELVGSNLTVTGMLFGNEADFKTIKANNAFVRGLLTTSGIVAADGTIINLESAYANIDFANIGQEAVDNLYAKRARIGNMTIDEDGVIISGDVAGVNIYGDVIVGNTIKADALIVRGSDGLYHKLNFDDGIKYEDLGYDDMDEEQKREFDTKLHGSNLIANSVTAKEIYVDDLNALDATIGGFHIGEDSIYSGVKTSIDNTTNGIYMNDDGEFYLGNNSSYLKFYYDKSIKDYRLDISAASLKMTNSNANLDQLLGQLDGLDEKLEQLDGMEEAIDEARKVATNYLYFDNNGLIIGDIYGDKLAKNVWINNDGLKIRNDDIVLSEFSSSDIVLGKRDDYHLEINKGGYSFKQPSNESLLDFKVYGDGYGNSAWITSKNNLYITSPDGKITIDSNDGVFLRDYGGKDLQILTSSKDDKVYQTIVTNNDYTYNNGLNYGLEINSSLNDGTQSYPYVTKMGFNPKSSLSLQHQKLIELSAEGGWARLYTTSKGNLVYKDPDGSGDRHIVTVKKAGGGNYPGLCVDNFDDTNFIRTTSAGFIPYQATTEGIGTIGTATWPFRSVYTALLYVNGRLKQYLEGAISSITVAGGGRWAYTLTFPQRFSNAPSVITGIYTSLTPAIAGVMTSRAINVDSSQCTLEVTNSGSASHTVNIYWIAIDG